MQRYRSLLNSLFSATRAMASSTTNTSLSGASPQPPRNPAKISDYTNLSHPPNSSDILKSAARQPCTVKPLSIKVDDGPDGSVPGFLHLPHNYESEEGRSKTAAILLSGAGGGVTGPSSIYLSMGDKLASLKNGIPVLRLDFRFPARNRYCCRDVQSAMNHLENSYSISRFVLVGWSFGGAPVFTVGGMDKRVVGCATVASQTAETEGIRNLPPRPVLLLHGTGDSTLSPSCSERLYAMYGSSGDRTLKLFERDDHALTRNSLKAEELLCEFIMKCAGLEIGEKERRDVVGKQMMDGKDKLETMRKGGDLRGEESVE